MPSLQVPMPSLGTVRGCEGASVGLHWERAPAFAWLTIFGGFDLMMARRALTAIGGGERVRFQQKETYPVLVIPGRRASLKETVWTALSCGTSASGSNRGELVGFYLWSPNR